MKRKDKLKVIHNALKLIAPNTEYELTDYDIFIFYGEGYLQIYSIKKSIYVETTTSLPTEILALFKLCKLSNAEHERIYDIIERNNEMLETIGVSVSGVDFYKATPISRDLFKTT